MIAVRREPDLHQRLRDLADAFALIEQADQDTGQFDSCLDSVRRAMRATRWQIDQNTADERRAQAARSMCFGVDDGKSRR